ncbi:hypothetical protein DTO166G4_3498 [Paecilomyces variotii]|uniref:NTF2 and RRM domain protein n=1 Tax=Byssochlamys spectabilis TaxID=264951 RepID=A0A443HT29_BYSSP|nr:NTF2 and RRM domain protein [Paecilomyces variotii]KAJ9207908.1 hypothetical protein DTO164E3_194 [Paecilomyces variotii]KAJ9214906.1 hypothetical protein DTO166G4_3498 [Paecilomyces variotii]KAJ9227396.1 hypothetical protein DTO169C6_37 [Paecilomyces variotii]KAJ9238414.1 hypothetical protein DTO166G5_2962 [Paecilomyces variotii]KAJ9246126.1 hypothetical protein DTO169E5_250 [Paecilomyces variotii]
MADTTQAPVNGNYAAHHAYATEPYGHNHVSNFQPAQSSTPMSAQTNETQKNEIPKDEVGWFFVEQYYTTLSRSPEKLHLFYSRRSQFVSGSEAESVPVAVGQKAIHEKIKQLDFQDCKVRVLNVDSQASFDNILVCVIGEISNRSEPSRKFVQTFVLAEQPNGYYVLNDVFRYLIDEEEEIVADEAGAIEPTNTHEEATAEAPVEVEAETSKPAVEAQVDNETAAHVVDEKLEEAATNGENEKVPKVAAQAPETAAEPEKPAEAAPAEAIPAEPEAVEEEKPKSPAPTPAAAPAKGTTPSPEKENVAPAKAAPALPKTWANIASKSGAAVATPVIPVAPPKPAAASAPQQPQQQTQQQPQQQPQQPQQQQQQPATPSAPVSEKGVSQPSSNDGSGWQTAGADHGKRQSRAGEEQNVLAYIKNVTEKVDAGLLKQTLSRYGKIKYFDVSRQKNCAFVEFADPAGYAAAVAANPHQIGSEQIVVEERRPRSNAYGGNANFGAGRGGARGRGDRAGSQGRGGGFQRDSGRGGFAPRGRGGNVAPKGRSQAQAA